MSALALWGSSSILGGRAFILTPAGDLVKSERNIRIVMEQTATTQPTHTDSKEKVTNENEADEIESSRSALKNQSQPTDFLLI